MELFSFYTFELHHRANRIAHQLMKEAHGQGISINDIIYR